MGFSDSFKKLGGNLFGGSKSIGSFAKRAKEGKMSSRDIFDATLGLTAPTKGQVDLFSNPFDKTAIRGAVSDQFQKIKGAAFGANLGHQLIAPLFKKPEGIDAPAVGEAPAQGATTIAAKRQARQRALNQASRRRGLGLSGTVRTSALGLQGDGAAVSQRRLIGE